MMRSVILGAALLSTTACVYVDADTQSTPAVRTVSGTSAQSAPSLPGRIGQAVSATVIGSQGTEIGSASFTQGVHGLLARVELGAGSLSPGWHGLHLHQVGDCSDVGVFTLSGGHVGKVEGGHGLLNPAGPEGGDTPNIYAAADGSAALEFITDRTSLETLLDADGSALIIHAGPDDHTTQPIGGAGARVACAVITDRE